MLGNFFGFVVVGLAMIGFVWAVEHNVSKPNGFLNRWFERLNDERER